MNSIGLDAHSGSFTMAVIDGRGKVTRCVTRATSAPDLIEAIGSVRSPNQLVVEESPVAQWVKSTLEPYVDRLVVCDPLRNRWIARDEFNDDRSSAVKLAELLRGGYIKEIHHPDESGAALRQMFSHYVDLSHQLTRFKNKLKALYRQIGLKPTGGAIYEPAGQEGWLDQLKEYPGLHQQAQQCFVLIETIEAMKQQTHKAMVKAARKVAGYKILLGVPGIGPVVASGYAAIIATPARFSRRNKLWRYAGLGNVLHISDEVVYRKGVGKSGNRTLKWLVMQQFLGAVERSRKPNQFKRRYEALLRRGLSKKTARRQISRSLLSVTRAVWMKGEAYREPPLS